MENNLSKSANGTAGGGLSGKMVDNLMAFSAITEVPISFFDQNGDLQWTCNDERKICGCSDLYLDKSSVCSDNLASSFSIVSAMGEPYIFQCKAGFTNIAVSLILSGSYSGCFIAGPIAMGKISDRMIENIFELNALDKCPEKIPKFTLFLRSMKTISPKDVSHLSALLNSCILSAVTDNLDYKIINIDYKEQAKIGVDVQSTKKKNLSLLYPYDIEKDLVQKIKNGDAKGAQETMQVLLNEVLLIESGNLDLVKTTMLEVCAVISRAAVEGGASLQQVFEKDFNYINSINGAASLHELRLRSSELAAHFSLNVFDNLYLGNSRFIAHTVQYVNTNYMNKISLKEIAADLHINPSYLSTHFNKEMGICFTDYVNSLRINKSKELLTATVMNLLDISIETGFEEQSYFTKVFKKTVGCTPNHFRRHIYDQFQL
jgi:two-component system response regulator YesN